VQRRVGHTSSQAIDERFASRQQLLEVHMKTSKITQVAGAVALALSLATTAYANDTSKTSDPAMTGKQKATAIGAGTGAVAGAVVGGPIGAVVGAGIGGVVGHQGTDANGKVTSTPDSATRTTEARADGTTWNADGSIRNAQTALNAQGYSAGTEDGVAGPNTQAALRKFQADKGLAQTGMLDAETKSALGI